MSDPMFLVVFPGQGSQKPGMSKDLVERFPEAAAVWEQVDAALGLKLSALAFDGDAEELTLTHNAQPALLAHSAAVWRVLESRIGRRVHAAAGHSLGEFSAYFAAGALSLEDAARLVRRRGELMLKTGVEVPGAMAAILGTLEVPIDRLCNQAEGVGRVVPANYNSPEQVVISGEVAAVEAVMARAKEAGAKRAVRLNVSGAFHSPLMHPAVEPFTDALRRSGLREPRFPVYSNVTADAIRDTASAFDTLCLQITSPVRWVTLLRTMTEDYPEATVLEMGTGNVLCGLGKRIAPEATYQALGTVAEVDAFIARLSAV